MIQLLGCVELCTAAGERVGIPERARRLLASLAWSPNTFVPDRTLVQQVWDDERPRHPRDALYTQAARLRKAIRDCQCIGTRADLLRRRGGYVLAMASDVVDLQRFRDLARAGVNHERDGDPQSALRVLGKALSLWHGEPLSDIHSPWADTARLTLQQEYRAAALLAAELSLCCRRPEECLPQLLQLTSLHPLDESVAGMLMIALHRSGRQDEALNCFQDIRDRMIEQIGDEPGPRLRGLHQMVLRRDAELTSATDTARLESLTAH
ncbi:AfsR/SARP family transcriptional regulator [Streptomyces prunicolor]|uniref:AfsR/SARP family transcriptional regulator n=1 Tax=Streptomyces prunicolor TaxID=67348 RepID=UPI003864B248|nr:AfsR/SARP family transcriptional regulator [Streptomyces prunicolor]